MFPTVTMAEPQDVELGQSEEYKEIYYRADTEREALLSTSSASENRPQSKSKAACPTTLCSLEPRFDFRHVGLAFVGGILACILVQYVTCSSGCFSSQPASASKSPHDFAPPYVGSTERHHFPPHSPTNAFPSLFPTNIGFAGPTPTGAEPALVITAPSYPLHTGAAQLVAPLSTANSGSKKSGYDLFKLWGNLSPWYSIDKGRFGVDSSPEAPDTCQITGLHFLHRHGARYPTGFSSYGGPAEFASRLHAAAAGWNTSGELDFMNGWTYKLGEEVLTPFGRQQLFDLGISIRMKYGFLLKNFTETSTIPVFRTESQHRMLHSALNFAVGFFGLPLEGRYQQSILIEKHGFNSTLSPYKTCPNTKIPSKATRSLGYLEEWTSIYLKDAHARLASQLHGYDMTIEDTYIMQQLCAYETVALGYSKFCELFTEEEWEGFNYALDLIFWYDHAFGSPLARAQGIGYVQELVARLTHTPIETHNSSTNATLNDNPVTFPLGQSLYVDATHEVVVLNIITALNLTSFAVTGPLPADHIPANRSFRVSELAPFATNIQFQLLSCGSVPDPQIRVIINDGVAPLTGVKGCPKQKDGMCPVDTFVGAQKEIIRSTDWIHDCHGDWTLPPRTEWNTTTGDAPKW